MIALVVLGAATVGVLAMNNRLWFQIKEETDAYIFPTEFEKRPETNEEWVAVYQIPEDILKNMSTDGLIETCLNYPLYFNMIFYSSLQYGFDKTVQEFNGLQELSNREDAGVKLCELYRKVDLNDVVKSGDTYALRMRFMEYIIAQQSILEKMNKDVRSELFNECMERLQIKFEKYPDTFAADSTLLIMGRIAQLDNEGFAVYAEKNEKIQVFLKDAALPEMSEEELTDLLRILGIEI